jgi:UDP-glucose 4-epimerase
MAWLITGGAGYIGAHVVRDMLDAGREVVVLDDLSTGRADRLPRGVPLIKGSITNRRAVRRAVQHESGITGVMHFAARKQVGESVQRPLHYWAQNVGGLQVVLEEMVDAGIRQMVLSSSAAVYGQPDLPDPLDRITERTPCAPINPYGATKLAGEWMLAATAAAHDWRALSLRYFNVAGSGSPDLGDPAALNLIPMVLEALDAGRRPTVFGDDYDTPDGSCVRDYIHVADLSAAHVAAARVVEAAHAGATVRSPQEKLQHAAARAEQAATRLPGGALAVEVATQMPAAAEAAAARAIGRMPRAVERATGALPWALRTSGPAGMAGQATEIVAEVASQLGSLAAKVAGVEEAPRLVHHLAVNVGTGRGSSVFEVIEALRASVCDDFAVDIVERRPGDPAALVAAPDLALALLGWRAKHDLRDMTDSAWAAWQVRPAG